MKLTIINHSDLYGRFSQVVFQFMLALRKRGIDARMVVLTKLSDSPYVDVVSTRFRRLLRFGIERQRIFRHSGHTMKNAFLISDASSGFKLWKHPWVKEADILHLGWINQGLLSLSGLQKITQLGKPVMWTMYDMWPFTGICHLSRGCTRFMQECGCCPLLNSEDPNDLSHRVWAKKMEVYKDTPIHFFVANEWMQSLAHKSTLLKDKKIRISPPPLELDQFSVTPTEGYPAFDANQSRMHILVKAPILDDMPRNLQLTIDALNLIFDTHPDIANEAAVIFVGQLMNPSLLDSLRFPSVHMGLVTDMQLLRQLYASCDVVLSTSKWELVGRTVIEGWASGCFPVSIGGGAEKSVIDKPGINGYIAEPTAESVAEQLIKAINTPHDREALRKEALDHFDVDALADTYIDIYNTIINQSK